MTGPDHPAQSIEPTTTAEENRKFAGQRRVNIIWEVTQAVIAISVTAAALTSALRSTSGELLSNAFFLVIGFYFGRTNHQRTGGVGGETGAAR